MRRLSLSKKSYPILRANACGCDCDDGLAKYTGIGGWAVFLRHGKNDICLWIFGIDDIGLRFDRRKACAALRGATVRRNMMSMY